MLQRRAHKVRRQPALQPLSLIVGSIVAAAIVAGVVVLWRGNPWGDRATVPTAEPLDPKWIGYEQVLEIPLPLREVQSLAIGGDGSIFVGGDREILSFDSAGALAPLHVTCDAEPACLAVGGADHVQPGRIYVGLGDHVEVFGPDGGRVAAWDRPKENARLTSIAVSDADVLGADSGNQVVWRYDAEGKVKNTIGNRDHEKHVPGFIISDPRHFDLAVDPSGLLNVINPRAMRIEIYTLAGDPRSHWGKGTTTIDGFFGCCNPAHLAILADGRYVTAEKGIPRVKVYGPQGKFLCAVVGPPELSDTPADIAADSQGRVLVLDATRKSIRIFQAKREFAL
jgi:hypothetical protein